MGGMPFFLSVALEGNDRMKNTKKNEKKKRIFTSATAICLLILIIIAMAATPVLLYYSSRMEAHQVLREAKNVQLAMKLVGTEYYGEGRTLSDGRTTSGLRGAAEEEVYRLADAKGELNITGWDSLGITPERFTYRSGNYLVQYQLRNDGTNRWTVSRLRVILHHNM